jgi:hypothetical protein
MMTQGISKQTTTTGVGADVVQNFLSGTPPTNNQIESQATPAREPLKHLLIGSSKAVTSTIHYLQMIGYAQVGDWSPLLPSPNPGEVMSILNRPIVVQ